MPVRSSPPPGVPIAGPGGDLVGAAGAHAGNNFGLLRLLFATLVIVSHSPELVDGNRSRELLTRLFGTLSFGEVGVDGFFLVSGYLVLQSWERSATSLHYLAKRVLRIYPAYVVAVLVSLAVFGPLSGATLPSPTPSWLAGLARSMLLLEVPNLPGAFAGLHYPHLNGSMWTIAYEFRCYLLVIALGGLGLLRARWALPALAAVLLALGALKAAPALPQPWPGLIGDPTAALRFAAAFCTGGTFYLLRDRIAYTPARAALAAALLVALMGVPALAGAAFAVLGGYLIFWFALHVRAGRLARLANRHDISYGTYLYAWPIQNTLVRYLGDPSPWTVMAVTLLTAAALGAASWVAVERPCLAWKDRLAPAPAGAATGAVP